MSELQLRVLEELRRIAKRDLEFEGALEPTMSLRDDLQLDSMGLTIVAVGLENTFRVKLDEEDAGELVTVADFLSLVERRVIEARLAEAGAA